MKQPRHWPFFTRSAEKDVVKIMRSGILTAYQANPQVGPEPKFGTYAQRLERKMCKMFNVKYAIACNSGTSALHMALHGLAIEGGHVVTSPFTFSGTAAAIMHAGAEPAFADVDELSFCITPETVRPLMSNSVKAIMPVQLFGYQQELEPFREFGVPIIEDACQAVGARRGSTWAGGAGDVGVFSFNGGKNCPAGEGGAVLTDNPVIAERARFLGNHAENFGTPYVGYNYRMPEITAAIAYHGLKALYWRNIKRMQLVRAIEKYYGMLCEKHGVRRILAWPVAAKYQDEHVYYVLPLYYTGGMENKARTVKRLKDEGFQVGEGYIQPTIDNYPAFQHCMRGVLTVAHHLSEHSLIVLGGITPPLIHAECREIAYRIYRACHEARRGRANKSRKRKIARKVAGRR